MATDNVHLADDELILFYYGETAPGPRSRAAAHLAECRTCEGAYMRLQQVLTAVDTCSTPDLPEGFERVVWARLQPELGTSQRKWFSWFVLSPARLAWVAAITLLVAGAFLAGRVSKPAAPSSATQLATSQMRERVLLADLSEHLDRSQAMLVELVSGGTDGTGLSVERERAEQLVSDNRLYRQTAAATGNANLVMVLDDLERVLVDIAASPDVVSAADMDQVRQHIESNGLLFKVRVLSSEVRERQRAAVRLRASQSS
jgi:anti-sigma factor RsiW